MTFIEGKTAVTLIQRKVVEGDTWIMFVFCMVIECHVRFMLEIMPSRKWHVSRILMSTTVAIGNCGAEKYTIRVRSVRDQS